MSEETPLINDVVLYLQQIKVTQAKTLANVFKCSKRTIFRKLKAHGYLTSYNKNGSSITLSEIPIFDDNGLWKYAGACFSKWKTLSKTIQYVVEVSKAGLTASECKSLLQVNVYNHLTINAKSGIIFCDERAWRSVYYSIDQQRREQQLKYREIIDMAQLDKDLRVNKDTIIKILVVALKHHTTSIKQLQPLLKAENIHINEKVIDWVFHKYQIKKKALP